MNMPEIIPSAMVAPCGINCMVCYVHLREKKPCGGCSGDDVNKTDRCRNCGIKTCAKVKGIGYCFECSDFPCPVIKRLEKSYTSRYGVSLIANFEVVLKHGLEEFLLRERAQWLCGCGGVISLHDSWCSECGRPSAKQYQVRKS